jgi:sec-independent protein translocase protein TatC
LFEKIVDRRNSQAVMGLGEHLEELRSRVLWAIVPLLPVAIVMMVFGEKILGWIIEPVLKTLEDQGRARSIQFTSAMETFSAYFYVAFVATVVVGGPWILYQLWKFIAPGLYSNERRFAYILAPLSVVLSIAGFSLMYFAMLPLAMSFLINFGSDIATHPAKTAPVPAGVVLPSMPLLEADPDKPVPGQMWINKTLREQRVCLSVDDKGVPDVRRVAHLVKPTSIEAHLKLSEIVDLFMTLALVFVLSFQLPVIILVLGWVGIVNVAMLSKWRKYAFAGSVILGAVVSPTGDPLSLAVLQVPLYLLYELGILLLRVLPAHKVAGKSNDADTDDHDAGGP